MSTLICDTFEDGGGDSASADIVVRGSAKAHVAIKANTADLLSELNVDSITDEATGKFTANFTPGALTNDYCAIGHMNDGNSSSGGTFVTWDADSGNKDRNKFTWRTRAGYFNVAVLSFDSQFSAITFFGN